MASAPLRESDIATALGAWDLGPITSLRRHTGGMNSATWLVGTGGSRWVAKAVPAAGTAQFEAGLAVAAHLEAAGLEAGAALPTRDGLLSVAVGAYRLALLRFVEGRILDPADPELRQRWGVALGQAHAILQTFGRHHGLQDWHWVDPEAPHLDVEPWVRPAVRDAVEELCRVQQAVACTYGALHADPAPEAFLINPSGAVAIIDWGGATWGPLLYDMASCQLYNGRSIDFAPFMDGFLDAMPLPQAELAALPAFLRFRWAVQADYFARRIQQHDLTGIDGPADNARGLADARRYLLDSSAASNAHQPSPRFGTQE